jgi:hypothetical protein
VGTATRYDVTLRKGDRVVELRDLRAAAARLQGEVERSREGR